MEEKTGIVKAVQGDGKFQEFWKFEVEMENGDVGIMYKKVDNPYIEIGQEIKYTLNKETKTLKVVFEGKSNTTAGTPTNYTNASSTQDRDILIARQTCIKASAAFNQQRNVDVEQLITDAKAMEDYVLGNAPF